MNLTRILKNSSTSDKLYCGLLDDLNKTESDLANAYSNLEYMVDPDLIDYYIYQVKAVQMRHKFLLSKVKQLEDSYAKNPLEVSKS